MIHGTMMDYPLTLNAMLERTGKLFPKNELVTRLPDGSKHRYTYGDYYRRTRRLGSALRRLGVQEGDRVGTLCWNHHWHLEAYFGIPAIGGVLHTLNLRLHPKDLTYIANHAEDKVIIVDRSLLPQLEQFKDAVTSLQHVIVIGDDGPTPDGYLDYETLIAAESDGFEYADVDERAGAAMCYTSGTTGHPKGVMYTHRSIVLHTMASCMSDALGIGRFDRIMPVVPMFHANAWGLPYDAVMTGAPIIFPGADLSPESLLNLMSDERVTISAGVPTIWSGILNMLDAEPERWDLTPMRAMVIGGSAAPPSMISGYRERHNLAVIHAWGMTETDPLATMAHLKLHMTDWSPEEQLRVQSTQGYPLSMISLRHVDDDGTVLPWDDHAMGELEIQGPWVTGAYYENQEQADRFTPDGWFKTGDIVTINEEGYIRITDRAKDVVKSGGEWISSVDLENALMAHPKILEAAVFAARHEKWDERPLAAVVLKPGETVTREELTAYLAPNFAKFWLPDDYIVIDEVPKTSVGKFQKLTLREQYGEYLIEKAKAQ